jgi:hypothetical protein
MMLQNELPYYYEEILLPVAIDTIEVRIPPIPAYTPR